MMAALAVGFLLVGWYLALRCGYEVARAAPGHRQHIAVSRYGLPGLGLLLAALICAARVGV